MKSSGNKIIFDSAAIKDSLVIDRDILLRIKQAIESKLVSNPELYGYPLRGNLKPCWKLRVGDYRVIYILVKDEVQILTIGHRKDVYRILEKRL